jgi:hypothetical protein
MLLGAFTVVVVPLCAFSGRRLLSMMFSVLVVVSKNCPVEVLAACSFCEIYEFEDHK